MANINAVSESLKVTSKNRAVYRKAIRRVVSSKKPYVMPEQVPYATFFRPTLNRLQPETRAGHGAQIALVEQNAYDRARGRTKVEITTKLLQKWRRRGEVPMEAFHYISKLNRLAPRNLGSLSLADRQKINKRVLKCLAAPVHAAIA